jgi:hypothetical protein
MPLMDNNGKRAQFSRSHALIAAPQQAVAQPPRQAADAVSSATAHTGSPHSEHAAARLAARLKVTIGGTGELT